MPNLFKSFLRPAVSNYIFPQAQDIEIADPPPPEPEPQPEALSPAEDAGEGSGERGEESGADRAQAGDGGPVVSFAQLQARKILEDARAQAAALKEQAIAQAQAELDAAREQARDEGYRAGYGEGLDKAGLEAQAQREQLCREAADQLRDFLERAERARDEMLEQTRGELCELSMAVAEKVIHVSLKSSREVIERMIQAATEKLKRREWVHIYISGADTGAGASVSPELMSSLAGLSDHIKIIPMADDEPGTCIIEMPDAVIDASVSTQLSNLREALGGG